MAEYEKPWLSVDEQIDRLAGHGVEIEDRDRAASLLQAVGYYRLTGYLYPFRVSEPYVDDEGRVRTRVFSGYRTGTTLRHAEDIIDFDRRLRMLVMDGVERIEVAVRMRIGHVLGRRSPFAYEAPACFTEAFTAESTDARTPAASRLVQWLQRVNDRKSRSDEQFVEHFREKYDDRMPVWALTEILKRIMTSWLASLNYVRNVAAHHSRLFNRKLQNAPSRPKVGQIPVLDHLRDEVTAKGVFGTYNALAVVAYVLPVIEPGTDWGEAPCRAAAGVPDIARPDDRVDGWTTGLGVARPMVQLTEALCSDVH